MVLTGAAAWGMTTATSDIDVYVVLADDERDRVTTRTATVDEIPLPLAELEEAQTFGREVFLWAFA